MRRWDIQWKRKQRPTSANGKRGIDECEKPEAEIRSNPKQGRDEKERTETEGVKDAEALTTMMRKRDMHKICRCCQPRREDVKLRYEVVLVGTFEVEQEGKKCGSGAQYCSDRRVKKSEQQGKKRIKNKK